MVHETSHEEVAVKLFTEGFNCAQSVFGAFGDATGLDRLTAMKLASSFGGGMGRLREVCGAVSGMFLVAGALDGYDDPRNPERRAEHYARIQDLAKRFREKTGSIVCRELLGLTQKSDPPTPEARTPEYYQKRPCIDLVRLAAQITEVYLTERKTV